MTFLKQLWMTKLLAKVTIYFYDYIVNDKKGPNIVNDSFAHKPDVLLVFFFWHIVL